MAKFKWQREQLDPRAGLIVTNIGKAPEYVARFYNDRDTARGVNQGRQEQGPMTDGSQAILSGRQLAERFAFDSKTGENG